MRFEFVWSLVVALFILCGAIAWTAASQPVVATVVSEDPGGAGRLTPHRPGCRKYAQYEFKVGYVVSPNCLPQMD